MMKLKMLVVAAGIAALPCIAMAQTPTDTTAKKDTMVMKKDTMTMSTGSMSTTSSAGAVSTGGSGVSALPAQSVNGPRPIPPSDGTNCPWKCPTSKGVAGLTGPQFLALQQELRDKGCGNAHVTGVLDGPTRRGIAICAKKLGVKNNAGAVLVAMNIGYTDADVSAAKME